MSEERKELIRCRTVLEILGAPKEHVEKTIKLLVEKIKENSEITVLNEKYADINEVKEQEKSMFSTFVELELILKGITTLTYFCFNFMPSSIDIEKPKETILKNTELSNIFNDLQAKLHEVDMVAKKLRIEGDFLKRNMNTMLSNILTILIRINKNTLEELSKFSGIDKDELKKYLEKMVKEKKLKNDSGMYEIV